MTQIRLALTVPALAVLLFNAGCSRTGIPSPADLPIVYKIDVQQGNDITQDMLAQLKPGMERAKVKFIMGTPMVTDTFHDDRWDYIYTMQKRGGERVQRRVSLFFRDDKLERVAGDVKPASGAIAPSGDSAATTVVVPAAEKGLISRVKDTVSGDDAKEVGNKAVEGASDTAATTAESTEPGTEPAAASSESTATESATSTEGESTPATDDQFVIDNEGNEGSAAAAATTEATPAADSTDTGGTSGDGLIPRFQAESNLEDAVLRDAADTAAEAASGADASDPATEGATDSASGGAGQSTAATIPDDAPPPKNRKGFFGRMLEKVGIGDDEGGDPTHRDVSDPEQQ